MQSSQNRPVPREVSDSRRRGSQHYYADVYENIDQAQPSAQTQRSPVREAAPQLPQHQQVPIEPGPPVANNASFRRGAPDAQRPPSYSGQGLPHEELLNKTNEAIRRRQEQIQIQQQQQQQQQQASRRRGYRRTDESGDHSPTTTPHSPSESRAIESSGPAQSNSTSYKQSLPNTRSRADPVNVPSQQSPRASSSAAQPKVQRERAAEAGNTIPRLNSPSVMSSVLQPLNGKIQEYNSQMNAAQDLMDQLDAEMSALQARRLEAEKAFTAAKFKHDDYRRQYQGVERAMRGEPDLSSSRTFERLSVDSERPSTQGTVQQQQRNEGMGMGRPVQDGMRSRTESWNSLGGAGGGGGGGEKRESGRFKIRNLFG